jgi:hypothetical protein
MGNKTVYKFIVAASMMAVWTACSSPTQTDAAKNVPPASGPAGTAAPTGSAAAPGAGTPAPVAPVTPTPPPPPPPEPIEIAAGTPIAVRMNTTLSTKTSTAGETFTAELARPLVVDGKTIAPRGAVVTGVIASADDGGRVKGRAHIALRLTQIRLPDGSPVQVATNAPSFEAKGTKKRDAVGIGVASGIGAAIGAIAGGGKGAAIGAGAGAGAGTAGVMATKGAAAVIPAETVVTFKLRDTVRINLT